MTNAWRRRVAFRKRDEGREIVAARAGVADSFITRGIGLLGRSELAPDEGLWIIPCTSIHMLFMRFSIDVIYLDKRLRITRLISDLKPWCLSFGPRGSWSVLELPAGTLAGLACRIGDYLEVVGSSA